MDPFYLKFPGPRSVSSYFFISGINRKPMLSNTGYQGAPGNPSIALNFTAPSLPSFSGCKFLPNTPPKQLSNLSPVVSISIASTGVLVLVKSLLDYCFSLLMGLRVSRISFPSTCTTREIFLRSKADGNLPCLWIVNGYLLHTKIKQSLLFDRPSGL